ncbi:MAG: hypothetical protein IJ358_00255 [Clostridia bacterium]|nr:hypothetical protein [Clostridia bacterium]
MSKNQTPKYEVGLIQRLLTALIKEDKMQGKSNETVKGDYLENGLKACKKFNKELDRSTFDR